MTVVSVSRALTGAAAVAILAFTSIPEPVAALATPHHNAVAHVARHAEFSPAVHGITRKRNAHQYRKRCAARTPTTDNNNNTNNNDNTNNNSNNTPAPSPQPQPQPQPDTGYAGNGKVGISWNDGVDNFASFVTSKVGYYYTWSPWCFPKDRTNGAKCAPMLWGWKHLGEFQQNVVPGYADVVLGFNEPDEPSQANMSPEDAANLWNNHLAQKKYEGYRLGSPACTGPGDRGIGWMHRFLPLIGTKPDFFAVHWYDRGAQNFISYIERYHNEMGGAKIWVTEFACQSFSGGEQCSQGEIYDFMNQVTGWMDSTWYVEAYFWFGSLSNMHNVNPMNQLMGYDGRPNDLGWNYLT